MSTCNRCEKLRLFLDAMKASGVNGKWPIEVLVIDNNSSDATKQVVEEYTSLENPVFRYLFEGRPGKSRALNGGICQARGEILAFTDDDCIPDSGWALNILKEFDSDPELSVLGGRVELFSDADVRQAVLLSNCRMLVRNAKDVCETPTIIGANMAFRKGVFDAVRGFDSLLGPGSTCRAAEDLDLVYRSYKMNLKIAYSPEVVVFHNHGRKTGFDENMTSFTYALGKGALYGKFMLRWDFQIVRIAFKDFYSLTKTLAKGVITRTEFPYHRLALPAIIRGAFYYCQARFSSKSKADFPVPERMHVLLG